LPDECINCKAGKSREIILAESREPHCGRCEIPLDNPEDIFCDPCRRIEYQEYPAQFIDYFEEEFPNRARNRKHPTCPRGHKFIKENVFIGGTGERRCVVCNKTKQMMREEERKKGGK